MKDTQFWLNLPVSNIAQAGAFYEEIGFERNTDFPQSETAISFFVGAQKIVLMLFREDAFESFIIGKVADTANGNEVLFNLSAESREEVDELTKVIREAGGRIFAAPQEIQGWMYGMGFADPDGHKWNVLFMDPENVPE